MALIYASIATYNCVNRPLARVAACVAPFVDHVFFVDGSWSGKPSMDKTPEVIFKLCREFGYYSFPSTTMCPWSDEFEKRLYQLSLGASGDWGLWIDSDELLVSGGGWLRRFAAQKGSEIGQIVNTENGLSVFQHRFYKHGTFGAGKAAWVEQIPVVFEHLRLGSHSLSTHGAA